jgi:cell division septal protein FtsQ
VREEVEELKKELNEVKEQSLAMEILKEQKKNNKRLFIALIVVLCMWFATIGYLVYVLNSIEVVDDIDTIEIEDVETIDNSHIKIGDDIWEKSE